MNKSNAITILELAAVLYGIELFVLTFIFRWYYFLPAIIIVLVTIDCMVKNALRSILFSCVTISVFIFFTMQPVSPSLLLTFILSFAFPAVMIISLLIEMKRQRELQKIAEAERAQNAAALREAELRMKAWKAKYGHMTEEEYAAEMLKSYSNLKRHYDYINQISDQKILADYVMGLNGFVKLRNRFFPEDTDQIKAALDKITDKALLRTIADQSDNWEARAHAFKLLGDRKNYLKAVISQPVPGWDEAKKALFPSYAGGYDYSVTANTDDYFSRKRNKLRWAEEELDILEKNGELTPDEAEKYRQLNG